MDGACQPQARSTTLRSYHPWVDAISGVRSCDVATGLTHDTIEMMNDVHQQEREVAAPRVEDGAIQWRSRYDGLVTIAELEGKAVAGISGPWSGQYALTWWDRPLPTRSLELFDSLEDAKREIVDWARRMRTGNYSAPAQGTMSGMQPAAHPASIVTPVIAANTDRLPASPQPTLFGWVRAFLPNLQKPTSSIERLRHQQALTDAELGDDLHFSADE